MRFTEIISEAGSPAQQAAIAIAMKKAGKKPKDVAEAGITGSSRSAEAIAKQKEWNSSSASDSKQDTKTFSYQGYTINFTPDKLDIYLGGDLVFSRKGNFADPTKKQLVAARLSIGKIIDDKRREALIHSVIQKNKGMQGVAEGSLNEFAPYDHNDDGDYDDEGDDELRSLYDTKFELEAELDYADEEDREHLESELEDVHARILELKPDAILEQGVAEGTLNELSSDLLKRSAQAATDKRNQAMDPELHNALGGGYMNPLATHYDNVSQKMDNRAAQVRKKETIQKIASKIASPAVMRKIGMAEQSVVEGSETSQQQQVRAAITKGMEKWDSNNKSTYQSQPTKTNYMPPSGYASDSLTGVDSIDPDGTVVISLGNTGAEATIKKLATLGGMPGIKTRQLQSPTVSSRGVEEGENWSKHNNPKAGGMSKKSVSSYRRSHPGSKIQTAVTTKPSKLKKGSKAAKRRASFCARMRGMKKHRTGAKTAHDPNSNINKSLRRWHCESIEELHELVMLAEQYIRNNKK
jgi:hypothetical protein